MSKLTVCFSWVASVHAVTSSYSVKCAIVVLPEDVFQEAVVVSLLNCKKTNKKKPKTKQKVVDAIITVCLAPEQRQFPHRTLSWQEVRSKTSGDYPVDFQNKNTTSGLKHVTLCSCISLRSDFSHVEGEIRFRN